jgi:ribosomal protein S27E
VEAECDDYTGYRQCLGDGQSLSDCTCPEVPEEPGCDEYAGFARLTVNGQTCTSRCDPIDTLELTVRFSDEQLNFNVRCNAAADVVTGPTGGSATWRF